jgi:FdhD protein
MPDRCAVDKSRLVWRGGRPIPSSRTVAEERPVALTYNGATYAVMMASPADLIDFGIGFSLSEGIIEHCKEVESIEAVELELGCEVRIWLDEPRADRLAKRRRAMVGVVGCGLCGIESLEQVCSLPQRVRTDRRFHPMDLLRGLQGMRPLQRHNAATHAMHAAAFWDGADIRLVREDVGRHNALDKLAGALALGSFNTCNGAVFLTSRVSLEMVQKTARLGAPILVAISAPTSLAIDTAERAGITLVAVAREDGYEIFSHAERLTVPGDESFSGPASAAALSI